MKTTSSLLLQVLVGFILVIIWLPSIIYFEYLNRINNEKTYNLSNKIKDYYLETGRIKKIGKKNHNFNTNLGPINNKNSILSTLYYYRKVKKVVKNQEDFKNKKSKKLEHYNQGYNRRYDDRRYDDRRYGNRNSGQYLRKPRRNAYRTEYYWNNYNSKTLKDKNFSFTDNNNVKKVLNMDDFKNSDFKNLLTYNTQKTKLKKKIKAYNVTNGKLVTIFAKNNNLERVKNNNTKIFYPGIKSRQGIIDDLKQNNFNFRWGMRLLTFLMLLIGLQLIASPLRYVVEKAPNILDFPILNLFKWILVFISDTILFFWDTFSIFGSLILTVLVTLIVFLLVNYPITIGISIATYFIITLMFLKKNK